MTVLSVSITESKEQIIDGIPRFVYLSTNIPSIIFYTLDGSEPDLYSEQYIDPIIIPQGELLVVLKVFASNGVDNSAVITEIYQSSILNENARLAHSGTDAQPNSTQQLNSQYPFGSAPIVPGQVFLGPQVAGYNVYDPNLPATSNAFDGAGNETNFTNQELIGISTKEMPLIYSDSDSVGRTGNGIGTLKQSAIKKEEPPKEYSELSDVLFDPRAMVIYQDFTKPQDPDIPLTINREYMELTNSERYIDGARFFISGGDTQNPSTVFLRQFYNPKDQTLTYYYRDFLSNRWIISKTPFTPAPTDGKYYNMVFSNKPGGKFVFEWIHFKGNFLY